MLELAGLARIVLALCTVPQLAGISDRSAGLTPTFAAQRHTKGSGLVS